MRVLIIGQPKSGTTALMTAVTNGLEADHPSVEALFEPDDLTSCDLDVRPLVAKKLLPGMKPYEYATFYAFDRRLLLIRDPRDRLISVMLYDIHGRSESMAGVGRWIEALKRKEAEPTSVPLVDLLYTYWEVTGINLLEWFGRTLNGEVRFHNRSGERFHVVRYEDFVAGEVSPIEDYLGFAIQSNPVVSGAEARVARTLGTGDWRNWMLPSDLRVMRPLMQEPMKSLGFDDVSWQVDNSPTIDPSVGSAYVESLIQRHDDDAGEVATPD